MGTWETSIFGDDVACDVRDHYRELIEDGVDDAVATQNTINKFGKWFDDPESGTAAIVGLAVTQSKIGRLDADIRERALSVIDQGGDLAIWARENPKNLGKRKAALQKARMQLTGPQPARKRLRPPVRTSCDLVHGDVLALDLPGGPVLIRTVYVRRYRKFESPILEELVFNGLEVPPAEIIQQLPAKQLDRNEGNPLAANARFEVNFKSGSGWEEAGFRKVANIPAQAGDETLATSGRGFFWWSLAELYRRGGHPI